MTNTQLAGFLLIYLSPLVGMAVLLVAAMFGEIE